MYTRDELETYACDLDQLDDPVFSNSRIEIIDIYDESSIEQIKNIPSHFFQVRLKGKLSSETVEALPPHIHTVIFDQSSFIDSLTYLPKHIECLCMYVRNVRKWLSQLSKLCKDSLQIRTLFLGTPLSHLSAQNIPDSIKEIGIMENMPSKNVKHIPPNKNIILTPSITSHHLKNLPDKINELICFPNLPFIEMAPLKEKKVNSVLIYFLQEECIWQRLLASLPRGVKEIIFHKGGVPFTAEEMEKSIKDAKKIYPTANIIDFKNNENEEENDRNEEEKKPSSPPAEKEENTNPIVTLTQIDILNSELPKNKKQKPLTVKEMNEVYKIYASLPSSTSTPLSYFWPPASITPPIATNNEQEKNELIDNLFMLS